MVPLISLHFRGLVRGLAGAEFEQLASALQAGFANLAAPIAILDGVDRPGDAARIIDWTLSSGWGASAKVTGVLGNDLRGVVRVTTNAADIPTANPKITLTFRDGIWDVAPFAVACMNDDGSGPGASVSCHTTLTTLILQYNGTPTAVSALNYLFNYAVQLHG